MRHVQRITNLAPPIELEILSSFSALYKLLINTQANLVGVNEEAYSHGLLSPFFFLPHLAISPAPSATLPAAFSCSWVARSYSPEVRRQLPDKQISSSASAGGRMTPPGAS
jgi:hypothetical protein